MRVPPVPFCGGKYVSNGRSGMKLWSNSAPPPSPEPKAAPEAAAAPPRLDPARIEPHKARARAWFEALRDDICSAFETLEADAPEWVYRGAPGKFVRTPWSRTDHTGAPGGGG